MKSPNVSMCLECKLHDCVNCLSGRCEGRGRGRPSKYDYVKMDALLGIGRTLKEIAVMEHVTYRTALRWEQKYFEERRKKNERPGL